MQLTHFLEQEYDFSVHQIIPAKRGFFGETWRIVTNGTIYFVKIDDWDYHKQMYQDSLPVIQYMTDHGIHFIPKVIKTKDGQLFCRFRQGIAAVMEYVEGENREDYPVEQLFEHLAPIYQLESGNIGLATETFGTEASADFFRLRNTITLPPAVTRMIDKKGQMISRYAERLERLSIICRDDLSGFHITHGDAGGNCILNEKQFYIIDWDSVKLAPVERDAWFFICDSSQIAAVSMVMQKHQLCDKINWERLSYYCYHSFFYYLTEYLNSYLCAKNDKLKKSIAESLKKYLEQNWIYKRLDTADLIFSAD